MARNATKIDFRISKMAAGIHFVNKFTKIRISKKKKLRIYLKWPEMRSKVNFGHPKWVPATIL